MAGRRLPSEPPYNFNLDRWSLHPRGSSYFLPINEMTAIIINKAMLELFDEEMAAFVLDRPRRSTGRD